MIILFTICGRAGSKGIKNKNIRNFLGKPLPLYTLSAIQLFVKRNRKYKADIALNTDSEELIEIISQSNMGDVDVVRRPPALGGDLVPKAAVILDSLCQMEEKNNVKYDIVVDLDITSPLRTVDDIDRLIKKKIETNCDVVCSVVESRRNPYFNMVKKGGHGYQKVIDSDYVARQQTPDIYDLNASMYAYSPEYLRSGRGVLEGYCEIIRMYDTGILDLDHENDFELMEVIAEYLFKKEEYGEIADNIRRRDFKTI